MVGDLKSPGRRSLCTEAIRVMQLTTQCAFSCPTAPATRQEGASAAAAVATAQPWHPAHHIRLRMAQGGVACGAPSYES